MLPQGKLEKWFEFSIGVSHTRKSLVKGERFVRGWMKDLSWCEGWEIVYVRCRLLEISFELKLKWNVWELLFEMILPSKSLLRYCENLQPALKCWVGSWQLLETISPSQFLVIKQATPPIIDFDYDWLEQAVRWRYLHVRNRSEI